MVEQPVTLHAEVVPDADSFAAQRTAWRAGAAQDSDLRQQAVDLQVASDAHHYTYCWEWLGVPVIRVPDDIVVLQELIWQYRPTHIVETGVARGGSMLLNASLQVLAGSAPQVLGIDISIFEHTRVALQAHPRAAGITLLEADSTSQEAHEAVTGFLADAQRALLILDSNHTHDHVLAELELLAPILPVGSYVLVADTLIEEFPEGYYRNRPWDRGNNPLTAVRQFLAEHPNFALDLDWSRRALLSEFRDGIIRKVAPQG